MLQEGDMRAHLLALAALVCSSTAFAECEKKTGYTLFDPIPDSCMRELSTDRPDTTESPYSVPAGHIQVEMDLFKSTRDKSGGAESESTSLASFNFKLGLTDSTDIQFVFDPYNVEYTREAKGEPRSRVAGAGDLTIRYKYNLWGNDEGVTALALMPFVTIPTNQRDLGPDEAEGGLIVPFGVSLGESTALGLMAEVDYLEDGDRKDHHFEYIGTITVGQGVTDALGVFAEFVSVSSDEDDSQWVGISNVGFTYGFTDDVQFDGGVGIGLNDAADDLTVFTGLTFRD